MGNLEFLRDIILIGSQPPAEPAALPPNPQVRRVSEFGGKLLETRSKNELLWFHGRGKKKKRPRSNG